MRVGIVSTYPPIECGIATYTAYLVDELKKLRNEVYVVSQVGAEGEKVYPVFNPNDHSLADDIFDTMVKFTPDVVHIQHEYGLYGKDMGLSVIPLLYKFKLADIPITVTLHTVYHKITQKQALICEAILRLADAVIVHHDFQVASLKRYVSKDGKIYAIPHGAREVEPIANAKEKLGVDGKKTIVVPGYFRPTKGYDRVVKIFPKIVKKAPQAWLIIAGKTRLQEYWEYRDRFFKLIDQCPAQDRITVLRGQFPQQTFDTIISAADVVPMPYRKGAQSGVMAHCFSFGIPVVVSPLIAFKDIVKKSQGGIVARSDDDFVQAIVNILDNETLSKKLSRNAFDYVKNHISWKIVAASTVDVYHKIVKTPYGKARYVEFEE